MHAALEDCGDEEDRRELRQLRWLHADAAEAEPAPRAVHGRAEEHDDECDHHEPEARPDERRLAVVAVVDPHHDVQHRESEQRPHALPHEEHRRLAVLLQRHRRRRAVHHDDAEADQQNRRDEQGLVRLEFPRHISRVLRSWGTVFRPCRRDGLQTVPYSSAKPPPKHFSTMYLASARGPTLRSP